MFMILFLVQGTAPPPGPDLATFISWLLAGGFEYLVRWVLTLIPAAMNKLTEVQRAFVAAGIGAVLQVSAFVLAVEYGWLPHPPPTALAWFNALFPYIGVAIGVPFLMSGAFRRQQEKRIGARVVGYPARGPFGHEW